MLDGACRTGAISATVGPAADFCACRVWHVLCCFRAGIEPDMDNKNSICDRVDGEKWLIKLTFAVDCGEAVRGQRIFDVAYIYICVYYADELKDYGFIFQRSSNLIPRFGAKLSSNLTPRFWAKRLSNLTSPLLGHARAKGLQEAPKGCSWLQNVTKHTSIITLFLISHFPSP